MVLMMEIENYNRCGATKTVKVSCNVQSRVCKSCEV